MFHYEATKITILVDIDFISNQTNGKFSQRNIFRNILLRNRQPWKSWKSFQHPPPQIYVEHLIASSVLRFIPKQHLQNTFHFRSSALLLLFV